MINSLLFGVFSIKLIKYAHSVHVLAAWNGELYQAGSYCAHVLTKEFVVFYRSVELGPLNLVFDVSLPSFVDKHRCDYEGQIDQIAN